MKTKEKKIYKRKGFFVITTLLLSCTLLSLLFMGMKGSPQTQTVPLGTSSDISSSSSGSSNSTSDTVNIVIEKPSGWKTKETAIPVKVTGTAEIQKVEAKIGSTGSYADITDDMQINLSENATVYVQVTDKDGKTYTKSRYIEIFDREIPTVKATIDKTLLRIEADDNLSGVYGVYVDGTLYTDLVNDTLDIKVSDLGKTYADISVQSVDNAGNKSKVDTVKNPNYKEETSSKTSSSSSQSTSSATSPQAGTGTTGATASQNGNATGANTSAPTSTSSSSSSTSSTGTSKSSGSSDAPLFGTYEDTNKQLMTIVTADGTVYYLIIDHDKEGEDDFVVDTEDDSFTDEN